MKDGKGPSRGWARYVALVGLVAAGVPLVLPWAFGIISLSGGQGFRLDYLMPAELAPLGIGGSLAIVTAAFLSRRLRTAAALFLAGELLFLGGSQALAVISGLAEGRIAAEGPWLWAVLGGLAAYVLCLVGSCGVGLLLVLRAKEKPSQSRRS